MHYQKIKNLLLDIIFPKQCLGCKKYDVVLCKDCLNNIHPTDKSPTKGAYLNGLFVAVDWQDKLVQKLVHAFKYNFVQDLKYPLSELMFRAIKHGFSFDYIIPVPLHKIRERWRGFNQAKLLAEEISKKINIPVLDDIVVRTKNTRSQVKKAKIEKRQVNIQDAFKICDSNMRLRSKSILLVDDVYTTGSTMREIAKILRQNQTREVWGLVIAKG